MGSCVVHSKKATSNQPSSQPSHHAVLQPRCGPAGGSGPPSRGPALTGPEPTLLKVQWMQ